MAITITFSTLLIIVVTFILLLKKKNQSIQQNTTKTVISQDPTPLSTPEKIYNPTIQKKPTPSNPLI